MVTSGSRRGRREGRGEREDGTVGWEEQKQEWWSVQKKAAHYFVGEKQRQNCKLNVTGWRGGISKVLKVEKRHCEFLKLLWMRDR